MEKKLKSYFDTHPDAKEVHVAREVLFVNIDRAQQYADLVKGQTVQTVTRDDYEKMVAYLKQKEMEDAAQKQSAIDADQKTLAGINKDFESAIATDDAKKNEDAGVAQKQPDADAQKQPDADAAPKQLDAEAAQNIEGASKSDSGK